MYKKQFEVIIFKTIKSVQTIKYNSLYYSFWALRFVIEQPTN